MILRRVDGANAFPRLFSNFLDRELIGMSNANPLSTQGVVPAANIIDKEDRFTIEIAAPGMNKSDFAIDLEAELLTITAESKSADGETELRFIRREFGCHSFARSFTLPKDAVDADSISAKYENGILQVDIPKKEEAKNKEPRKIEVA